MVSVKRHMEVFIVEMSVTYFNVLIDEDVLITSCLALPGMKHLQQSSRDVTKVLHRLLHIL